MFDSFPSISSSLASFTFETMEHLENALPIIASSIASKNIAKSVGFSNVYQAMAIGGMLGSADLISNYFHYYNRSHITFSILSASTLSKLPLPYGMGIVSGATLGLMLSNGVLNNYHELFSAAFYGALYGYGYAKFKGAAFGALIGIIDELCVSYGIFDNYYSTTAIKNFALSKFLFRTSYVIKTLAFRMLPSTNEDLYNLDIVPQLLKRSEFLGSTLTAIEIFSANNTVKNNDTVENISFIKTFQSANQLVSDLMGEFQLYKITNSQLIFTILSSLIIQDLEFSLSGMRQNVRSILFRYSSNDGQNVNYFEVQNIFLSLRQFSFEYVLSYFFLDIINSYLFRKKSYLLSDILTDKLAEGENMSRFANSGDTDSNTLIKRKSEDIDVITKKYSSLISQYFNSITKGTIGISVLLAVGGQNIIQDLILLSTFTNNVSNFISKKKEEMNSYIAKLVDEKTSMEEYWRTNADHIIQTDAGKIILFNLKKTDDKIKEGTLYKQKWSFIQDIWHKIKFLLDFLVNHEVIAKSLYRGQLQSDEYYKALFSSIELGMSLNFLSEIYESTIKICQSVSRLGKIKEKIIDDEYSRELTPIYHYQKKNSEDPWVCFEGLTIDSEKKTNNKSDVCLYNEVSFLKGESDIEKISFFKLIKGIKQNNVLGADSIVFYTKDGTKPHIIITEQNFNYPPYVTLLQAITLKLIDNDDSISDLQNEIKPLIKEVGLEPWYILPRLCKKEDSWNQYINLETKNKLSALRILFEKPDIVLANGIFTGLDQGSVLKIQLAFKNHLPNSKIIVINSGSMYYEDSFYQDILLIEGGKIESRDFFSQEDMGY